MSSANTKVSEFFAKYKLREFPRGQVLLLNGDDVQSVYLLEKGKVKVYDVSYRGDEAILNVFKPGAYFPMSFAFHTEKNKYIYEAETDIVARQAPIQDVLAFLKKEPDVTLDLLGRLYQGIEGLMGRISYLMSGSARDRLLYELLVEARRFGTMNDNVCDLTINEKELGARAGLSRETVSREMHKLKAEKLVTVQNKVIRILSMSELREKLSQEA